MARRRCTPTPLAAKQAPLPFMSTSSTPAQADTTLSCRLIATLVIIFTFSGLFSAFRFVELVRGGYSSEQAAINALALVGQWLPIFCLLAITYELAKHYLSERSELAESGLAVVPIAAWTSIVGLYPICVAEQPILNHSVYYIGVVTVAAMSFPLLRALWSFVTALPRAQLYVAAVLALAVAWWPGVAAIISAKANEFSFVAEVSSNFPP